MKTKHPWLKQVARLGFLLMMGAGMSAEAGLFGSDEFSWKEEVLLHDGRKIIVKRSQSYGGRREVGQSPPIKEHVLSFQMPGSGKPIRWVSEFSQDLGRANFNLLALHVLNDTPYLVTTPNLCLSYAKWGRPNPPYVLFRHDGIAWRRIALTELPGVLTTANVIIDIRSEEDIERATRRLGYVSADATKEMNASLTQPEYKTILREPLASSQLCPPEQTGFKAPFRISPKDGVPSGK